MRQKRQSISTMYWPVSTVVPTLLKEFKPTWGSASLIGGVFKEIIVINSCYIRYFSRRGLQNSACGSRLFFQATPPPPAAPTLKFGADQMLKLCYSGQVFGESPP